MDGKRGVAIYTRVSTRPQDEEGASLETQEKACREKLAQMGYDPERAVLYREVHTGIDLFERPVLSRLRAAIRQLQVALVVVYDLDRLSRDNGHLGVLFTEGRYYGVRYVFVRGEYEDTLEGEAFRFAMGMSGKIEHERIRDKARRGHRGRVDAGLPIVGPRCPYGYRWIEAPRGPRGHMTKVGMEPDPETAPIVRRIFRDLADGKSARQMAKELTDEGIDSPSRRGNPWNGNTITLLIREPVYVGERQALRNETFDIHVPGEGRKKRRKEREQPVTQADLAPALVSKQVATLAAWQLAHNKSAATRNNQHPGEALLRGGFIKCGYCGCNLIVKQLSGGRVAYACGQQRRYGCPYHTITIKAADQIIWDHVRQLMTRPDVVASEMLKQHKNDTSAQDLAALDRRLGELQRQQANLITRIATVVDDAVAALVTDRLTVLTSQVEQLQQERTDLHQAVAAHEEALASLSHIEEWCHETAARLDTMTYDERRALLRSLLTKVTLWRDDHHERITVEFSIAIVPSSAAISSMPMAGSVLLPSGSG